MIFFLFEPTERLEKKVAEIPNLEIYNFKVSELNINGLTSIVHGETGRKYTNRYTVDNLNYTDNSSEFISNIKSNKALYKNYTLNLEGDIKYFREDGLIFTSQKASYDKQTAVIISYTDYQLQRHNNKTIGTFFEHDDSKGVIKA